MTAWKPIDTAPRDRPILVKGGSVRVGGYSAPDGHPNKSASVVEWFGHWGVMNAADSEIINPTEWEDIPE